MVNGKAGDSIGNPEILSVSTKISQVKINILVVDDSNYVRESLNHYLAAQPDFSIVGSVDNVPTALEQIKTLNPDLVLMDIEMPGINGIEATKAITQQFEQTKVIVLSSHKEPHYVDQVLDAGAKGYLLKTTPLEDLANSIRFVHKGYWQFSPGLLEKRDLNKVKHPLLPGQEMIETSRTSSSESLIHTSANQSTTQDGADIIPTPSRQIQRQAQPDDWSSQTKELIDALPRVWTRGLLYFLAIFTAIALPWAMFSQVDETGTAKGRLEPKGKTFILDAPVAGTVAKINVKTGDVIEAGQSLLELDSEQARSQLQQLQTKLTGQQNQLQQLELLKQQLLLTVDT
jgi:hemolysin D